MFLPAGYTVIQLYKQVFITYKKSYVRQPPYLKGSFIKHEFAINKQSHINN